MSSPVVFTSMYIYESAFGLVLCLAVYLFIINYVWLYLLFVGVLGVFFGFIRRWNTRKLPVDGKAVFITGCDSGLGYNCAKYLDSRGFVVFAGCLESDGCGANRLRAATSDNLHIVPLDVTKDDSVQAAHDYVVKHMPKTGLWAIVNNAGIYVFGDVEWLTVTLYNKIMDVNFYGAVRVFRTFLHLIRKSKGRVVVVSSVRGRHSWPGDSPYHASKFALEATVDSLRFEMTKFGVHVSKVQPGNFSNAALIRWNVKRYEQEAGEMWTHASDDVRATYGQDYVDGMVRLKAGGSDSQSGTSQPVSNAIEDAMLNERPETSYLVDGVTSWIDIYASFARHYWWMPTWLSDWIIVKWSKCDRFPDYSEHTKEF